MEPGPLMRMTEVASVGGMMRVMTSGLAKKIKNELVESEPVSAMAFLPEIGLVTAHGGSVSMNVIANTEEELEDLKNDNGLAGEDIDVTYISPVREYSVLVKKIDGTYERTFPNATKLIYNAEGFITSLMRPDSKNTLYIYNDDKKIDKIIVPGGDYFQFEYNGSGYLTSVTDPAGRVTTFDIDGDGNLLEITNPDASSKKYTYNTDHLLDSHEKEDGEVETYEYARGRLIRKVLPGNRINNLIPSQLVGINLETGFGEPIATTDTVGSIPSRGGGCNTRLGQDRFHIETVDCLGNGENFVNDANGMPTATTSKSGRSFGQTYDSKGRTLSLTGTDRGNQSFEYDQRFGEITKLIDNGVVRTEYVYATNGLPEKMILPSLGEELYSYSQFNILETVTNALNESTHFETGDGFNNSAIVDALNNRTEFIRDAAGNLVQIKDPQNRITSFEMDLMGRITKITDPRSGETNMSYLPGGKLLSITDAKFNTTSYEYNNDYKFVSKVIDPSGKFQLFEYDNEERISRIVQEDNSEILFQYDLSGRLTSKTTADNLSSIVYDRDSLPTHMEDSDSSIDNVYDSKGRLTRSTQNGLIIDYAYDSFGRRQFMLYADASGREVAKLTYGYDEFSEVNQIVAKVLNRTLLYTATRDVLGRVVEEKNFNNMITARVFDAAGRLSSISNSIDSKIISKFEYTYSPSGTITNIVKTNGGYGDGTTAQNPSVEQINYSYNENDELLSSSNEDGTQSYDLLGNRNTAGYVHNNLNPY